MRAGFATGERNLSLVKMRAAVAVDYDDIRIEEREVPQPGPDEALVQIKACGICSGDVTPWYIRKKCPIVVGHEPAGVVVESRSSAFAAGDRVFVHHHAPCFQCRACRRGFPSMCSTWRRSSLDPGGIAEFVRVPRENLAGDTLKLPEGMSFEQATLIEPVACVVRAFKRAPVVPGDRVAILGLGFIGQVMVQLARLHGASLVLGSDPVAWRRQRALENGADHVFEQGFPEAARSLCEGGADLVLVGPSSPAAMLEGIECAGQGSTVLFFMGPSPDKTLTVNPHHLFFNEISLVSSYSCGPEDTRDALALLASGRLASDRLITHRFPLEQTLQACRTTARAQDSLKVVVTL